MYDLFTLSLLYCGSTNDTNKLPMDSMSPIIYLFREKYPMIDWWNEWLMGLHSLGVLRKSETHQMSFQKRA